MGEKDAHAIVAGFCGAIAVFIFIIIYGSFAP